MAIYHMSAQVIGRSSGRSATAAAAYRAGERIADERTGEIHDYSRKGGVDYKEIMAPKEAGEWATNRAELWNKVEQSEKRKDSQLAREINIAIPKELNKEEGRELVREYAQKNFVDKGMIADISIHHSEKENPHAHMMLTMRQAEREGFGQKVREWNDKEELEKWREEWAHSCNKALEKAGLQIQVNHKSLEAQGIDRKAQIHEGPIAREIENKGRISDRSEINRQIVEDNRKQEQIEKLEKAMNALTGAIKRIEEQQEKPQIEVKIEQEKPQAQVKIEPEKQQIEEKKEPEKKEFSASEFLKNKQAVQEQGQAQRKENIEQVKTITSLDDIKAIARTRPLSDVRAIVQNLNQQAKQKDLMNEVQNTKEYIEKRREISALGDKEESAKKTADNFQKMKEETKGLFKGKERAGYENQEKEYRQKQFEAAQKLKEAEATLKAVEHNLSRPESELAKSVNAHNENATKAALALEAIRPIYNERQEQEKQIQQEQERTKQQTKGDFER